MGSSKYINGNAFNIQESKIIEEEIDDYEPIFSPMPRLEENKSSNEGEPNENDDNFFDIESNFSSPISPTPRFDKDYKEITIMSCEAQEVIH